MLEVGTEGLQRRSSVAWRLGDVPASDSRAELGVGTERTAGVELLHLAMLLRCLVEAGMW